MYLFEKDSRLGGHTHTHLIETSRGPKQIDSGFIVHNDLTYPNLIRLFDELGLQREDSEMSWGVTGAQATVEYSSKGLNGFFASRSSIFSRDHWKLLRDILRFNREAVHLLEQGKAENVTLGALIDDGNYSRIFQDYYLYPTVAAIWSTSPRKVLEFPAATLIRFFQNHGLLTVSGHPRWKVLTGGSSVYIEKLTRPLAGRIQIGKPVVAVWREAGKALLKVEGEQEQTFDHVVLAAHAPRALAMLKDSTPIEREVLESFRVTSNEAVLHTDTSILPKREAAWASWNYRIPLDNTAPATLTYDMNRLQNLNTPERYLVSLNSMDCIDPAKILRRMNYQHPLYNLEAIRAQARWGEISGVNTVHFCGAYWHNGFHEDGYKSALRVSRALGVDCTIY